MNVCVQQYQKKNLNSLWWLTDLNRLQTRTRNISR